MCSEYPQSRTSNKIRTALQITWIIYRVTPRDPCSATIANVIPMANSKFRGRFGSQTQPAMTHDFNDIQIGTLEANFAIYGFR